MATKMMSEISTHPGFYALLIPPRFITATPLLLLNNHPVISINNDNL